MSVTAESGTDRQGSALQPASPWFRVRHVAPRLDLIDEPHVDPLLRGNIWHLRGRDRDLVVDTGLGVASLREELPGLFERDPIVVLTHGHLDHAGGAHEFDRVWAHAAEPVASPLPGSLHGPTLFAELGIDLSSGDFVPAEVLLSAVPTADYDARGYRLCAPLGVETVVEGDILDLGDRQFTVLHLPGHTPGTIGLYSKRDGILFSGDFVYDGVLLDEVVGSDIPAYLESAERVRALGATQVYPGHGDPFGGERLEEILREYVTSRTP